MRVTIEEPGTNKSFDLKHFDHFDDFSEAVIDELDKARTGYRRKEIANTIKRFDLSSLPLDLLEEVLSTLEDERE